MFRFSPERLRLFGDLFQPFAEDVAQRLGGLLHAPVQFRVRDVDQRVFHEFEPARSGRWLQFARLTGSSGTSVPVATSWENRALVALMDKILGADEGDEAQEAERDPTADTFALTRFELRLVDRIQALIFEAFCATWSTVDAFAFVPAPGSRRAEDAADGLFLSAEMVVAVHFALEFAGGAGEWTLWLPCALAQTLVEGVRGTQSGALLERAVHDSAPEPQDGVPRELLRGVAQTDVLVSVQLPGGKVRPEDVMAWQIGDCLELGKSADTPFQVLVQGLPKHTAAPGKYRSRKAFRIL